MKYLEQLNWRYATKRMNGEAVPAEKLENILEAIRLAPTSLGLQAFEVIVIEDAALKAKLAPAIYNQPQITEGGAVLVFAAKKETSPADVEDYINLVATTRNAPAEKFTDFKNMILGAITSRTAEQQSAWNARQTYIALGVALTAAALEKVDSTPMEGFDPAAVDEVLGLSEKGLFSTVVLALGYRDEAKDYLASAPKVRRPAESIFQRHPETEFA